MKTPASPVFAALAAILLLLAFAAACGGDSTSSTHAGRLTDPRDVATDTPWPEPPTVIPIDPNSIAPITGASPTPNGSPSASPSGSGQPGICGNTYTIKAGDTLFDIATKCKVSLTDLKAANPGLDPATLRIGQTINMPGSQ